MHQKAATLVQAVAAMEIVSMKEKSEGSKRGGGRQWKRYRQGRGCP